LRDGTQEGRQNLDAEDKPFNSDRGANRSRGEGNHFTYRISKYKRWGEDTDSTRGGVGWGRRAKLEP